jgi:hypothetical protein
MQRIDAAPRAWNAKSVDNDTVNVTTMAKEPTVDSLLEEAGFHSSEISPALRCARRINLLRNDGVLCECGWCLGVGHKAGFDHRGRPIPVPCPECRGWGVIPAEVVSEPDPPPAAP